MRAFVAIELQRELRRKLQEIIDGLREGSGQARVKWVKAESIHLTLKFLGEIEPQTVEKVRHVLDAVAQKHPKFNISVGGFGCFPNQKKPRVFWIGLEAPNESLLWLQSNLESQLADAGLPREERSYQPHLTIGRVRSRLSSGEMKRLSEWAASVVIDELGEMEVDAVSLMQSELRPSGAVHTTIHQAILGA